MAEIWVYVVGGVIVALIAFTIAYNLLVAVMENAERQNVLQEFSDFYTDVNTVCLQEIGNSKTMKVQLPSLTRIIYSTDEISCNSDSDCSNAVCINNYCIFSTVVNLINKEISKGQNICLQFKDENFLRCYPEIQNKLLCNVSMHYLGVLPETEDIWVKVNKILGYRGGREYVLSINKTGPSEVNISLTS
jgi:hypothetical protein